MNNISVLQEKLTTLIEDRYQDPQNFEKFAKDLLSLGITKFYFDAFKDEMSFYTNDQFVHSVIRKDLKEAREKKAWVFGEQLEIPKLEQAIKELDDGMSSIPEFHRKMYAVGVISCLGYLTLRKIYYMGQDGQFYLENY